VVSIVALLSEWDGLAAGCRDNALQSSGSGRLFIEWNCALDLFFPLLVPL
jgi:hypothetical protein